MSAQPTDPDWGDDVMAIAEAVGVVRHPECLANYRPHPSVRGDLSDLALALAVETWSQEFTALEVVVDTDHVTCGGCGEQLCGCEDQCPSLERDVCFHNGRSYCPGCAPHYCVDCKADSDRWDYDPEQRGDFK